MKDVRRFLICAAAASMLMTLAPAEAAKPPLDKAADAVREIRPDEDEPSQKRGSQRINTITGAPITVSGLAYKLRPADGPGMARQYLRENASMLGLKAADLSDLETAFVREGPAGVTVRFRQHIAGVPVYGSDIAVTIGPGPTANYVSSSYRPQRRPVDTESAVSEKEAVRAALDYLQVDDGLNHETARLVVYVGKIETRLAWELRLAPRGRPVGDWEVLVDAHTGELFKVVDRALHVDGNGNVFDPDPLSSSGAAYNDPGYTDGSDGDTAQLSAEVVNVVLRDITSSGGTFSLVGPWAAIGDFENPSNGTFSQGSSTFNFTRNADGFEAVNTYFHIDHEMRHLNVDLGLNITPYQYSGGVQFDPHGLNGSDNSHYITSSGRLAFGEGGVDDAEDADVVIHELGHGLHDWVTGGGLSQVNGLSEGSGDYIAQSYSRSLGQWTPADTEYQWVFNWDGHNSFWGGRTTGYGAIYPGGLVGQIHTDGQIWSTCNMLIWDQLGRDLTDAAFWSGLGMTGSNTNQEDAAQAVLQAAVNMGYTGAQVSTMESIYQGCGYNVTAPCTSTCGNNIIECNEVCDGTDLGGRTCGDEGCSGGSIACNVSCSAFDTSACTGCPLCDNDGVCEAGEDCGGCPNDCVNGTVPGATCGNGLCEAGDGEDCVSCPQDCNGKQNGNPGGRFCCGDGGGSGPVPCSDARCTTGGFSCTDIPGVPGSFCCGLFGCENGEGCGNCALDCATAEVCGDGSDNDCDGLVDCADSDCSGDPSCNSSCGNGVCESGEDCNSCSADCDGRSGGKPANRFCCGDGTAQSAEGNGSICDGNF